MLLKLPELIPDKEKPFSKCKLDREQYASILTDILKVYLSGFVLAIDNPWGTGKTTFVKMWKQYLENNGFKTLYFNAWENDSENEIFITLISELQELKESKNEQAFKKVIENASPLARSLITGVIQTLIEKYVGKEFSKQALSVLGESITENLEERIKAYVNRKEDILEFKKSLEAYVSVISEDLPLVFIIDELDRCRPNYAVEFLEQIKHIFNVNGIVFVLSIDKTQLGNAIKGFYGSDGIDATEYLRRFIDIEYSLPNPNTEVYCNYLYQYFKFDEFLESLPRLEHSDFKNDARNLIHFTSVLFKRNNLALRVQEKIFAHARIAMLTFDKNHYLNPTLFILLIYLRTCYFEIYEKIKNHKFDLQELIDNVESILPESFEDSESRIVVIALASLIFSYNNTEGIPNEIILIESTKDQEFKLEINSRFENVPEVGFLKKALIRHQQHFEWSDIDTDYLIHRIELTDSIKHVK